MYLTIFFVCAVSFLVPLCIAVAKTYTRHSCDVKMINDLMDSEHQLMEKAIIPREEPVQAPPVEVKADEPAEVVYTFYTFDSGPTVYKGWDIHERMLALEVNELPDGLRYSFFPTIKVDSPRGRMEWAVSNAVVIMYKGHPYIGKVPADGGVDVNFKIAAGEAYSKFDRRYSMDMKIEQEAREREEKQRRIIEFAKGKPEMLVLGDEQKYVED